jgi:ABC-2 type transport system ATP-binding protein
VDSDQARFDVDTVQVGDVLKHLIQFDIRTLTSTPPTLEELFLRHYGELARESNAVEASSR